MIAIIGLVLVVDLYIVCILFCESDKGIFTFPGTSFLWLWETFWFYEFFISYKPYTLKVMEQYMPGQLIYISGYKFTKVK